MDLTLRPVRAVPDLVVEVLCGNRLHDRVTKRLLYADAGVLEYWMVDLAERHVEVGLGPGLRTVRLERGLLTSPHIDGFSLELAPVFDAAGPC